MEKYLKVAVPKGYLLNECIGILDEAGYDVIALRKKNRKLVVSSVKDSIKYIISRPMDVPVYVEYGACDIGFCGKDVLEEKESKVYELLDIKNGICRLVVATLSNGIESVKEKYRHLGSIRVATSYPNIARKFFDKKGMQVQIIKLHGSVELAPILGIADEILDITSTGETLKQNNLVEMEDVMTSTTRLIANIAGFKTNYAMINNFIKNIKKAIG